MKQNYLLFFFLLFITPLASYASPENKQLEFVENKGQWVEPFLYKAGTGNGAVYLEKNGFTYVIGAESNLRTMGSMHKGADSGVLYYHAYKVFFENARQPESITPAKVQSYYNNYFRGSDPKRWKGGIHPCLNVDYKNIYNGVDLHVSSENQQIKYDLILQPGIDPSVISMRYVGTDGMKIKNDMLYIQTSVGNVMEMKPYAYQYINGARVEVNCKYKLTDNIVSFSFPRGYDANSTLVIDPKVIFATFTGSSYDNWGFTATYDSHGNFYAGGITSDNYGGSGYPVVPAVGAIQSVFRGGKTNTSSGYPCDIAIMKIDSAGTNRIYSTYLGGADNEQPHSLYVDANDNLVIVGRTYSSDTLGPIDGFPTTPGAYDRTYNGEGDMVIVKFNSTGTALLGSTFLGGKGEDVSNSTSAEFGVGLLKHNYGDDARSEVILDKAGNIYVAACTKSDSFPTTATAIKFTKSAADTQDAIVLKMNSTLTALVWSTYIGGSNADAAYVLALDTSEQQLFVGGGTKSTDFLSSIPGISGGLITAAPGGDADGFILRFQNGGTYAPQKGTYIGANDYDQVYGVQVDLDNNVYAMGQTMGGQFESTYVPAGVYKNANSSQFVIKLDNNLATKITATVFGSGDKTKTNISPVAFLVDTCQNVYISGWGGDLYTGQAPLPAFIGNTFNMPVTANAVQSTTDGNDMYFIVFSKNLLNLQYATFRGAFGGVSEHVDGGTSRFDKTGIVYQAICGGCGKGTFPTEPPNALSLTNPSNNCNLVALKIAFELGAVKAKASAQPSGSVCLGRPINFTNGSTNATNYDWDFGDGTPGSSAANPVHIFTKAGMFKVRMIAINPNACKVRDTVYLNFTVDTNAIDANFNVTLVDSCKPYTATFTNTSKYSKTPASTKFTWVFGDGSTSNDVTPPTHSFPDSGYYTITLIMEDTSACNSPDSIKKTIHFNNTFVKADVKQPNLICIGSAIILSNRSTNATNYKWQVSNGYTSTKTDFEYKFDSIGKFTIKLYAYNPTSCNKVDSVEVTLDVMPTPTADFTHDPIVPITNVPITYTNKSTNAIKYAWSFGDNTGSSEKNPVHFFKRTGTYTTCLTAINEQGCADTICKKVDADVFPLADLPTAFTPNGDGSNDILYVRGAGIESIDLKIYNRWGELVFSSTDQSVGWDGTYKGKPQEMEAYAFTLSVRFVDETTYSKKGNVTLLR